MLCHFSIISFTCRGLRFSLKSKFLDDFVITFPCERSNWLRTKEIIIIFWGNLSEYLNLPRQATQTETMVVVEKDILRLRG